MQSRYVRTLINAGFTLLELLCVLALLGALAATAAPAMRDWLARDQVEMQAQALLATLAYARGEAIRRAIRVTLCRDDGYGRCCANHKPLSTMGLNNWARGYLVLAELPPCLTEPSRAQILSMQPPMEAVTIQSVSAPLSFTPPAGQIIGGFRSFEIGARTTALGPYGVRAYRCVRVAAGGRSRIFNGPCAAAPHSRF
ncbi:MAG: type IV fimbrial biogenesis protein FimT [Glomeribacter sp. 1016415]|nr:type IV fimbrial biogenesis protein FimT [Glomeribacter sp. 1016415]